MKRLPLLLAAALFSAGAANPVLAKGRSPDEHPKGTQEEHPKGEAAEEHPKGEGMKSSTGTPAEPAKSEEEHPKGEGMEEQTEEHPKKSE